MPQPLTLQNERSGPKFAIAVASACCYTPPDKYAREQYIEEEDEEEMPRNNLPTTYMEVPARAASQGVKDAILTPFRHNFGMAVHPAAAYSDPKPTTTPEPATTPAPAATTPATPATPAAAQQPAAKPEESKPAAAAAQAAQPAKAQPAAAAAPAPAVDAKLAAAVKSDPERTPAAPAKALRRLLSAFQGKH